MKMQEQNWFQTPLRLTTTMVLFRAQLRSRPANGYAAFFPQLRKIVFEFCDKWPSSANTATYLLSAAQSLARQNPHVEVVVKQRNQKEPIVRGFYRIHISSISISLLS
jgi:large subunit ribosomal protein L43